MPNGFCAGAAVVKQPAKDQRRLEDANNPLSKISPTKNNGDNNSKRCFPVLSQESWANFAKALLEHHTHVALGIARRRPRGCPRRGAAQSAPAVALAGWWGAKGPPCVSSNPMEEDGASQHG